MKKSIILFAFCILHFYIFTNYIIAGTPHNAYGKIYNSDSSVPANGDISFEAYIKTRPYEVLTESSTGCYYSSGYWKVDPGNFPTAWSPGEKLKVEVQNTANGESGYVQVTLTEGGSDQAPDLHLDPPPSPDISVTPSSKNYGNVEVGSNKTHTFVVSNEGDANLSVSSTIITGGDASEFSITSGGGSFTLSPGATRNVRVRFDPGSVGAKSTTMRIANNDPDEDPKDVPLSGNGVVIPDINVSPGSKNYGNVQVGSNSTQTFVVTNEGTADLNVTSTSLQGTNPGEFDITSGGGSFTLSPGANRNVNVRFSPTSVGAKSATLRFNSNDPDENPKNVSLSGNGVVPDIAVSPTSKNYGNIGIGSGSTQKFVVTNQGGITLSVTSTSLVGADPSEFSIISGGGSFTLSPGANRDVNVRFSPSSAGAKSATLRFQSNDPDENPKDVSLSGNGITVPDIGVSPGSKNYGDVEVGSNSTHTFEVTNTGTADLSVTSTSIVGADAGDFSITSGGGSFTLSPGANRNVSVSFSPSSAGAKSATLRFNSNDPNENPKNVSLSGNGVVPDIAVSPTSKNYGDVAVGSSLTHTFQVSNQGGADLSLTSASIVGADSGEFSITSGGGSFTLGPGANRNVDVRFEPTSEGAKNATLRFASNDPDENPKDIALTGNGIVIPDIAVNPPSKNFGDVTFGSNSTQIFEVTNEGTGDLNISETSLQGPDAVEFSIISGGGSFTLSSGASQSVQVQFSPTTAGPKTAELCFVSNDPDENPKDIPLSGNGVAIPLPDIAVDPPSKDYGKVIVDSSSKQIFVVTNEGTLDLEVTSISLRGNDSTEFNIEEGGESLTLAPGETHLIEVSFNPVSSGIKTAFLRLSSNDPNENPLDVALSGIGAIPDIAVNPASKNFGSVWVDSTASQIFSVINEGTLDLEVTSISLKGKDSTEFNIEEGGESLTLAPGETHLIEVSFNPISAGAKNAILCLLSNDPDENPLEVELSGNGVIPDIDVNPAHKNFGSVWIDSTASQIFNITNQGNTALEVTSISLGGKDSTEFNIQDSGKSLTLGPGETHDVKVSFNPVSTGIKVALLRILSNDPDENLLEVALIGTGVTTPLPDIDVYPPLKDFGIVLVGSSSNQVFVVTNVGMTDLEVSLITLTGKDTADFRIESGGEPFTLKPGETHNVKIIFEPISCGKKTATLQFASNDPNKNPLDTALSGEGGDSVPPNLTNCYPPPDASAVPKNTDIQFKVQDDGDGVDLSTLEVLINGTTIVSGGVDLTGGRVNITSHSLNYSVLYDPFLDFPNSGIVSVQVQCQDLAPLTNMLDSTYYFTIGTSPVTTITEYIIDPNGGTVKDKLTKIEISFPPGAVDDSTKICIGFINTPPALPDSVNGIGLIYYFGPNGLQFNDWVTIQIPYKKADLDSAGVTDPLDLPIYYYSTTKGKWIQLEVETAHGNHVYVKVKEFCYLVLGKSEGTGIEKQKLERVLPTEFSLMQNYPNPFNPETVICYQISRLSHVKLEIYNMKGQYIKTLADNQQTPGTYEIVWNGLDNTDHPVPTGVYILRMKAGAFVEMIKMSFCK